jgi:hypothetical protein
LYVADSQTQFSINVDPASDDINFYFISPDWYQYTALGFGSRMVGSLMLVFYPAADGSSKRSSSSFLDSVI